VCVCVFVCVCVVHARVCMCVCTLTFVCVARDSTHSTFWKGHHLRSAWRSMVR